MPQVGDKHFPYTKAGYKAAAKERMGHKDYRQGGLFYVHGGLSSKKAAKKATPSSKRSTRKAKYKKQVAKLLRDFKNKEI